MNILNTCLTIEEIYILKNLTGKELTKYRHDEFFLGKGIILGNAEFFIENKVYTVTNYIHNLPFFWGEEDICNLGFKEIKAEDAKSYCLGEKQIDFPLNKIIKDIIVVNDSVEEFENKKSQFLYKFTRGIIFVFDDIEISFEKETWMSEYILVKKGNNILSQFRSPNCDLSDWAENQDSKSNREIIHLTNQVKK